MNNQMQVNSKKIYQASLLVVISGILYGFLGFLGIHILRENISISAMLFWRFLIAGSWMMCFVVYQSLKKRNAFQIVNKRTLFYMFWLGAIGYAGSSEFYFIASQYTGTGLAMVIFFSYPVIVAFLSWVIHRQNIALGTLFILFAMIGGLFLLRDQSARHFDMTGIFFAIIAACCYTFYVMGSKRISSVAMDSNVLTTIVCFGCAFIFLLTSILSHHFVIPHTLKSWLYLFALGILATALPIQLMLEGLKYVSSMRASLISVLEPLVTIFIGVALLHESVSHLQLLGACIILGSAMMVQFQRGL